MTELTPIQLLIWIILLEIASVPIVAFLYTWISNIRFNKNREFLGMLLESAGKTIRERTGKGEENHG